MDQQTPTKKKQPLIVVGLVILASFVGLVYLIMFALPQAKGKEKVGDRENYDEFDVIVETVERMHKTDAKEQSAEYYNDAFFFTVRYPTEEDAAVAIKESYGMVGWDQRRDTYKIVSSNVAVLYANGFFDDFKGEGALHIRACHFIYGDSNHFFIAEVIYEGKTYLSFDEGLENNVKEYK